MHLCMQLYSLWTWILFQGYKMSPNQFWWKSPSKKFFWVPIPSDPSSCTSMLWNVVALPPWPQFITSSSSTLYQFGCVYSVYVCGGLGKVKIKIFHQTMRNRKCIYFLFRDFFWSPVQFQIWFDLISKICPSFFGNWTSKIESILWDS